MSGRPLRTVLVFLLALGAAAYAVHLVQQRLYARPPADDLTPAGSAVGSPVAPPATRTVRTVRTEPIRQ